MTSHQSDQIREAYAEAMRAAWSLAKAERLRELRGDRSVRSFDQRGLHPYSAEWGRILALEALMGDASMRVLDPDTGELMEPYSMRKLAAREAEKEFAERVKKDEGDVWA